MLNKIHHKFFPHENKPEHIKSLDGLRGIAVIIVLLAHSHHVSKEFIFYNFYGRTGVYLFYILSAYLLDKQIIGVLTSHNSSSKYWLNYGFRRFLRIYPLFFCALIFYYLLNRKYVGNYITSIDLVFDNLLLKEGTGVFWSIPVEFKYYIISPFLMLAFHKFFKWKLRSIILCITSLLLFSFWVQIFFELPWTSTLKSLPAFLVGSLMAILEKFNKRIYNYRFNFLGAVGILGVILINPFFWNFQDLQYKYVELVVIFILPLFLAGLFLSSRGGLFRKITELRIFRFIGTISFSVYVFHLTIAWTLKKYGPNVPEVEFILYFILSILLSTIPYLLIEYPLSKLNIKSGYKYLQLIFFQRQKGKRQIGAQ